MDGKMKAARGNAFGDPTVLQTDIVDIPQPGAGQVLVKLFAVGVNPYEVCLDLILTECLKWKFRARCPKFKWSDFASLSRHIFVPVPTPLSQKFLTHLDMMEQGSSLHLVKYV